MTNIEALDIIFNFFPSDVLEKVKQQGLYNLILSKKVRSGAEIYDHLSAKQATLQDTDYTWLADSLTPLLRQGSILQIGCGRGHLLMKLASYGFHPIFGIDRSEVMLEKTKQRMVNFKNVHLFQEKVEDFNFNQLHNISNVVINNFWGILAKESSVALLKNLKNCLNQDSLIIIGPCPKEPKIEKLIADKTLKQNLGFTFSFPFFQNFSLCGYSSEIKTLSSFPYFLLTPQS